MKDAAERFMKIALAEARKGMNKGNRPYGAVIVKDGTVVSKAHSTSLSDHDVTAHAELKAIRKFFRGQKGDLKGSAIYATGEPCLMCSAAIGWANISELVIAANSGDAPAAMAAGRKRRSKLNFENILREYGSKIKVRKGVLRDAAIKLYDEFVKRR